jgi:hypothetical protein
MSAVLGEPESWPRLLSGKICGTGINSFRSAVLVGRTQGREVFPMKVIPRSPSADLGILFSVSGTVLYQFEMEVRES